MTRIVMLIIRTPYFHISINKTIDQLNHLHYMVYLNLNSKINKINIYFNLNWFI